MRVPFWSRPWSTYEVTVGFTDGTFWRERVAATSARRAAERGLAVAPRRVQFASLFVSGPES